jgi:hypothetical protein
MKEESWVQPDLRRYSSKLFGSEHRLVIAAAIGALPSGAPVKTSLLREQIGIEGPYISGQLGEFVALGMLEKLGRDNYRRLPSAYWGACTRVLADIEKRLKPADLRSVHGRGSDA